MHVSVEKFISSLQVGFKNSKNKTSEQHFQNVPFSAINYSFTTNALRTGQRNYEVYI